MMAMGFPPPVPMQGNEDDYLTLTENNHCTNVEIDVGPQSIWPVVEYQLAILNSLPNLVSHQYLSYSQSLSLFFPDLYFHLLKGFFLDFFPSC